MKDNAYEIIGKTIIGVTIKYSKESSVRPQSQLFLVFDDDSCFEFYCYRDGIRPTGGLLPNAGGDYVANYMKEAYFIAYQAAIDPESGEVMFASRDRGV